MMKQVISVLFVLFACAVRADYLYWQVNTDVADLNDSYARLCVNGTYLSDRLGNQYTRLSDGTTGTICSDWGTLGTSGSYAFQVELWSYADVSNPSRVGSVASCEAAYADLVSQGAIYVTDSSSPLLPQQVVPLTFTATPEPSSLLLLSIGLAALSLRRRIKGSSVC